MDKPALLTIHGIRSRGEWQEEIEHPFMFICRSSIPSSITRFFLSFGFA
jgi:hypothetical protein